MLGDAIGSLRASDDWAATTLIGAVLVVLSVFVLPVFVVQGYLLRVLREAAEGADAAPSFTRWGELFVDGLKAFAVELAYGLVAAVPYVLTLAGVGVTGSSNLALSVGFLLALVLSLAVSYLLPAAVANFAVEGRLAAAFDLRTVLGVALTWEYLAAVLLAVVVSVVGGVLGGLLAVVLVGFAVLFYVQVVTFHLYGQGYAAALSAGGRR
jgi:hypothetical protein